MNALANPQVGRYLNRHFVSGFQKIATFQINWGLKQGGNVAGYFCTTDGRVLHAVAGPVDAAAFLREARWANETYQLAQLKELTPAQLPTFFRQAHLARLQAEQNLRVPQDRLPRPDAHTPGVLEQLFVQNAQLGLSDQSKVNLLLAVAPMPRLNDIYAIVFERILNEQISTNPVRMAGR